MKNKFRNTNSTIKAGDLLLNELPFAFVLSSKEKGLRCDNCLEKYVPKHVILCFGLHTFYLKTVLCLIKYTLCDSCLLIQYFQTKGRSQHCILSCLIFKNITFFKKFVHYLVFLHDFISKVILNKDVNFLRNYGYIILIKTNYIIINIVRRSLKTWAKDRVAFWAVV